MQWENYHFLTVVYLGTYNKNAFTHRDQCQTGNSLLDNMDYIYVSREGKYENDI